MQAREADVLIEQMAGLIEQSHRLQLEMFEMWKVLLNVSERAPYLRVEQATKESAAGVLPDRPTFTIVEAAGCWASAAARHTRRPDAVRSDRFGLATGS